MPQRYQFSSITATSLDREAIMTEVTKEQKQRFVREFDFTLKKVFNCGRMFFVASSRHWFLLVS